ncbi:MAG: bifunctional 4-hydroxy-2-oxoglutarate aldolase/2-dehydro-3-deoxy-phosphogluconate aldolase [Candidatus Omnitrophica bacterium]|nr:bifunctional 4-hydroxy-2-oxoglutarate aldolase/2-dehydro-3-deoxy-phosphogluconate aldolase [Candidatus Omnitrophota bacterium]
MSVNGDTLKLQDTGICAIIRLKKEKIDIKPLIDALMAGGIQAVEVSFDTAGAPRLIKEIKEYVGEKILLGAGTIFNCESAMNAIENGAQFLISPHLDENLLRFCEEKSVPCIPGVFSPTEISNAYKNGAKIVKLYPVSALGCNYIKTLKSGPFKKIIFMAVGGIDLSNAADFILAGASILGIGSALINDELVDSKNWEKIKENSTRFIRIVKSIRGNND